MQKRMKIDPASEVAAFNERCTVGSKVSVLRDNGAAEITVTTSEAFVLSGHTAVIYLQGFSGCFMLSRVSPIAKEHA